MCVLNVSLNMNLAAGGSLGLLHVSPLFPLDWQPAATLAEAKKGKPNCTVFQASVHIMFNNIPLASKSVSLKSRSGK